MEIRAVTYLDFINQLGNFISLDISIRSTGWVKSLNGQVTYGVYSLQSEDDLLRRQEFKKFLKDLVGQDEYDACLIEDVIASCNFKTAKGLIQLNTIVDDLVYEKELKIKEVVRRDNKIWKKHLRLVSGYKPKIIKGHDKDMVREALNLLGFCEAVEDDIYDAMGLAVGVAYEKIAGVKKKNKLKDDITKSYKVHQFKELNKALDKAVAVKKDLRPNSDIVALQMLSISRDLPYNFKRVVKEYGDDKIFVISVSTNKLGVLALKRGLDVSDEVTHLVVYR